MVTLSSVPHIAHIEVGLRSSASMAPKESHSLVSSLTQHSPHLTTTPVPDTIQPPLYITTSLSPASFQSTPAYNCAPRTSLTATATEFYLAFVSQQNPPLPMQYPYLSPQSLTSAQQSEAWTTIAQAIKQGPSLPKVELMKFDGDPLEYAEFFTNFRDNIESQVADESQRLTRLLAQCFGKAKDAIRSCVNLPVGCRYSGAWNTLRDNFGRPHMVVKAHMKKLREIQVRKADASALMDFVRRLEDARRVLTSMGCNYSSRLDNEDVIIMLMKKLPDEGLKRKWVDRAGDLIKNKGRAEYPDFVSIVGRAAEHINNRYGQELKSSSNAEREKKESGIGKTDYPLQVTTPATHCQEDQQGTAVLTRVPLKCPQCSGPHGVWRCRIFRSSSLRDRLKTVRQHQLCRACLSEGHNAKQCPRGFACVRPGCGKTIIISSIPVKPTEMGVAFRLTAMIRLEVLKPMVLQ